MGEDDDKNSDRQKALAKGKGSLAINAAAYANVTVYQYVTYEGGRVTTRETTDPSRCPYPGLETFRTSEAAFFAGREEDIAALEAKLKDHDVCGVIAASGAGKSSLVHAGLIPALAERETEAWDIFVFKPGQEPLYGLARSMSGVLADASNRKGQFDEIEETVADLRETPGRLRRYVEEIISRRADAAVGKRQHVLIFIDQWEELYTRENDEDRDILLRELLDVAERGLAKVLLTMRIDFMEDLVNISTEFFRGLKPAIQYIEPMGETGLRSAIENPARQVGLKVPEALTSRLIADLRHGKDHGSLPYLQFVLRQLWEQRDRKKNSLTTEAYNSMEGLKGAIGAHADAEFQKLTKEEQNLAERILPRLANVPDTGAPTSRRLPFADFDEPARDLLRKLAEPERRLIVLSSATEEVSDAEIVAEVAHEALLDDWKSLAGWINDRKDFFRLRNKLEADAKTWIENKRSHDFLIPAGKPLLDAQDLQSKAQNGDMSEDLKEFIGKSVKKKKDNDEAQLQADAAQLNRLKTRNRGLMALSAVLIAATIGAGYFWTDANSQRNTAETLAESEKLARTSAEQGEALLLSEDVYRMLSEGDVNGALLAGLVGHEAFESDQLPSKLYHSISAAVQRAESETIVPTPSNSVIYFRGGVVILVDKTKRVISEIAGNGDMRELVSFQGSILDLEIEKEVGAPNKLRYIAIHSNTVSAFEFDFGNRQKPTELTSIDLQNDEKIEKAFIMSGAVFSFVLETPGQGVDTVLERRHILFNAETNKRYTDSFVKAWFFRQGEEQTIFSVSDDDAEHVAAELGATNWIPDLLSDKIDSWLGFAADYELPVEVLKQLCGEISKSRSTGPSSYPIRLGVAWPDRLTEYEGYPESLIGVECLAFGDYLATGLIEGNNSSDYDITIFDLSTVETVNGRVSARKIVAYPVRRLWQKYALGSINGFPVFAHQIGPNVLQLDSPHFDTEVIRVMGNVSTFGFTENEELVIHGNDRIGIRIINLRTRLNLPVLMSEDASYPLEFALPAYLLRSEVIELATNEAASNLSSQLAKSTCVTEGDPSILGGFRVSVSSNTNASGEVLLELESRSERYSVVLLPAAKYSPDSKTCISFSDELSFIAVSSFGNEPDPNSTHIYRRKGLSFIEHSNISLPADNIRFVGKGPDFLFWDIFSVFVSRYDQSVDDFETSQVFVSNYRAGLRDVAIIDAYSVLFVHECEFRLHCFVTAGELGSESRTRVANVSGILTEHASIVPDGNEKIQIANEVFQLTRKELLIKRAKSLLHKDCAYDFEMSPRDSVCWTAGRG